MLFRKNTASYDATQGSISKYYLSFFWPVLLGNFIQQLYNVVDTVVVGRYIGEGALAAVGASGTLVMMAGGLGGGLVQGACIRISQSVGSKDTSSTRKYIIHAFYLYLISVTAIMIIFISCNHLMLSAMNTLPELYEDIRTYQIINYIGLPALLLYRLSGAICQAMGDSKTPVFFMTISSISNIALNLLFVIAFEQGVAGVAIATVLSQLIAAVGCIIFMKRRSNVQDGIFYFKKEHFKFSWRTIIELVTLGVPLALQFCIILMGSLFIQTAMNDYTSAHIAASSASGRITSLFMQAYLALGATVSVFVAQNYGACNFERIKKGIRLGNIMATGYSLILILLSSIALRPMLGLLLGENLNDELFALVELFYYATVYFMPTLGVLEVYRSAVRGLGGGIVTMVSSMFEVFGKSMMVFVASAYLGFDAIRFSNPISWIFTLMPLIPYYYIKMRKEEKLLTPQNIEH